MFGRILRTIYIFLVERINGYLFLTTLHSEAGLGLRAVMKGSN